MDKIFRMSTLYFVLILPLLLSCSSNKKNIHEDSVPIYFGGYASWMPENIKLWLNDSLIFNGKFKAGHESSLKENMLLTHIYKEDRIATLKIRVGTHDSTFYVNPLKLDTLLITYKDFDEPYFLIWSNHDNIIWSSE